MLDAKAMCRNSVCFPFLTKAQKSGERNLNVFVVELLQESKVVVAKLRIDSLPLAAEHWLPRIHCRASTAAISLASSAGGGAIRPFFCGGTLSSSSFICPAILYLK